jgi:hypothetical protein
LLPLAIVCFPRFLPLAQNVADHFIASLIDIWILLPPLLSQLAGNGGVEEGLAVSGEAALGAA